MEIPHEVIAFIYASVIKSQYLKGAFCDLMWSDPEEIETWSISNRGAGWLFGARVVQDFNHLNNLDLICRAH